MTTTARTLRRQAQGYELHYCYQSSPAAVRFGRHGFYIVNGPTGRIVSPQAWDTFAEAESWAKSQNMPLMPHTFGQR